MGTRWIRHAACRRPAAHPWSAHCRAGLGQRSCTPTGLPSTSLSRRTEARGRCSRPARSEKIENPCCPEIHRGSSRGLPIVVVQQSPEARPTGDLAICPVVIRRTDVPDELATNALVESLGHVVLDEFLDQEAQMSLTKNHEVVETLVLDCLHKPLGVRIAIWALRRDLHALHAPSFENRDERLGEQRIAIVDQVLR